MDEYTRREVDELLAGKRPHVSLFVEEVDAVIAYLESKGIPEERTNLDMDTPADVILTLAAE